MGRDQRRNRVTLVWTSDDLSCGEKGIVDEIGRKEESSDDPFLLSDGLVV